MEKKSYHDFELISSEKEINNFISHNENTLKILKELKPLLKKHFPNCNYSLELCEKLGWTTETKLLLNIEVSEKMFFNGMLKHFNEIYKEIEPLIENIENTVVLFPVIKNK